MGTSVNHLGPAGSGQLAKLANQLIVGVTIGAVAEAFVLAKTGGLSLTTMREALMGGFADSQILRQHGQRIIDGHFTPGAHATTQLKDLSTATDFGRSLGVDLPITSLVEDQYQMMCERGFGDLDHSALFKFFTTRKDKS
jgi:2-hydroxy-3-oxopropionate reductase